MWEIGRGGLCPCSDARLAGRPRMHRLTNIPRTAWTCFVRSLALRLSDAGLERHRDESFIVIDLLALMF